MSAQRVSQEQLERSVIEQGDYFASFRAGIDCIGGAQAKAGYDALLDLRDARAELAQLRAVARELAEALEEIHPDTLRHPHGKLRPLREICNISLASYRALEGK